MYSLPVKEIIRGRVIDDGGLATESLAQRERRVKTAHLNLRLGGRNRRAERTAFIDSRTWTERKMGHKGADKGV